MTTRELRDRITIQKTGYGHWKVTIEYRGRRYSCTTTNSLAVDDTQLEEWERRKNTCGYSTCKQAYQALYDECKRANDL